MMMMPESWKLVINFRIGTVAHFCNMVQQVIMFPTLSDMAIPIENVLRQMLARATRVIFSHIAHVGSGLSHSHECYCHGANALRWEA